ncbi:MAG: methylamine dehydrogenase accessory protein MauD [Rubrivivax sp.]
MNEALIVSNALLWVAVLVLLVALLALARQVGILHERIAPMGALMMDSGPKVGEEVPRLELPLLGGGTLTLGGATGSAGSGGGAKPRATLVFFVAPTCPVCKKLLPIVASMRAAERAWLDVVLASDGEPAEHAAFRRRARLEDWPYVLSAELGMRFRVSKLPYALLIDEAGRVRAKGLVNSREQLESLFAARELGVASVQEYLEPYKLGPELAKERAA